jgi:L-lactate dehydrogenase complex protein LldG
VARAVSDARAAILARIGAVGAWDAPPAERDYRVGGSLGGSALVDLFCERVADYRAEVRRVASHAVAAEVASACAAHEARRLVVPPGLRADWRPAGAEAVSDAGFSARDLDAFDGVVTGCTVAVADTGTIVLTAGPEEGRRALTLVPDLHICIVEEQCIVECVPEAMRALAPVVRDERRPITLVSGPSATSDIELSRVEGVHGPRSLVVLVVGASSAVTATGSAVTGEPARTA